MAGLTGQVPEGDREREPSTNGGSLLQPEASGPLSNGEVATGPNGNAFGQDKGRHLNLHDQHPLTGRRLTHNLDVEAGSATQTASPNGSEAAVSPFASAGLQQAPSWGRQQAAVAAAAAAPKAQQPCPPDRSSTYDLNTAASMGLVQMPPPMPKWPTNWTSSSFEAVAFKKSFVLSPPEVYAEVVHHGEEKARFPVWKMALLSWLGGMYVGFGYTTLLMVGGNQPKSFKVDNPGVFSLVIGSFGFPFGFTLIVMAGAELFTSLCAYMAAAWWEGRASGAACLRVWVTSWSGNFAGAACFVALASAAGTYEGKNWYALYSAEKKALHLKWGQVVASGILANIMVGLATWMANAAQDLTGKAVGIWLAISAFGFIGFEHCVANMFLLTLALSRDGVEFSVWDALARNLVPATLGNFIGGTVFVATAYAFLYGSPPRRIATWFHKLKERKTL